MKVFFHGAENHTNGEVLVQGDKLPEFNVENKDVQLVTSQDLLSDLTLISVVPDLATSVCSLSTKKFNQEMDNYAGVKFYTISTNTVSQQKAWCAAEGVDKMELLSDLNHSFGMAMNLYISELNVDARSVWVVNKAGEIIYREVLSEQSHEPNYQAVLEFLQKQG